MTRRLGVFGAVLRAVYAWRVDERNRPVVGVMWARSRVLGAIAGPLHALVRANSLTALYYPERFILSIALFGFPAIYCHSGQPEAVRCAFRGLSAGRSVTAVE